MTTEQQFDSQDSSPVVGPGQLLRTAREAMGWSREQVASRLHLRLTLVAAIESDTYDKHTSPTFIRGYLRTYAKLVGIEESKILEAYAHLGLEPVQSVNMQSFSKRTRREASNSRLKIVTWLVVLALAGLLVAWWWQESNRRAASQEQLAASEIAPPAVESAPADATEPAVGEPVLVQPSVVPSPEEDSTTAEAASAAVATEAVETKSETAPAATTDTQAEAQEPAGEAAAPADAPAAQLKMSFTADCWLDVKDASGKTLFSGLKRANDELLLEGKEPLRLHIGAPMAIRVQYKGQEIDMSRYNNGRTARMTLPQE
ncbi:cytoskeleton protein RodZ [Aeromonas diversa]|uniref:cytoskeleton protein RodZ n=1 Tax=Aeromonas diversa TaxID=502790 RepID=UPI003462B8BC